MGSAEVALKCLSHDVAPQYFVHPTAIVETESIGEGTRIWAFAHIMEGARIGKHCNICDHTFIECEVEIGDNVHVKNGVCLWNGVKVEDDVFIGPNVVFTNDRYPRSRAIAPEFELEPVLVRKGASIGANSTVLCGVTIGRYSMVGAGSIVVTDVPDYSLVYGNRGNVKGYICKCTKKLQFERAQAECECGRAYLLYHRYRASSVVVLHRELGEAI
ncbi:MAG: acyltransferase [Planctomycetota bacterium]|jgi:acetyltransferase-like isoleucine patch superfamily enzyme